MFLIADAAMHCGPGNPRRKVTLVFGNCFVAAAVGIYFCQPRLGVEAGKMLNNFKRNLVQLEEDDFHTLDFRLQVTKNLNASAAVIPGGAKKVVCVCLLKKIFFKNR